MARRTPGARSELIHCDACGEDYSSTYKRCPFCGEKPAPMEQTQPLNRPVEDDYVFEGGSVFDALEDEENEHAHRPKGGKRLAGGAASGGGAPRRGSDDPDGGGPFKGLSPVRLAGFLFTLVVIIAAIVIVTRVIMPMVQRGSTQVPDDQPGQSETVSPAPGTDPEDTTSIQPGDPAESSDIPETTVPVTQTATGFTIDRTEFTISDRYPDPVQITATLTPSGSTGTITWTSSDPAVATVSATGLVSAVGRGRATITASLPGAEDQTCLVISSVSGPTPPSAAPSPSPTNTTEPSPTPTVTTPSSSGSLTLSREDFTMNDTWPTYTFEVTGASGTVTWRTSNSAVATVDATGTVNKVGTGTCTITATDSNGNTATCIVRCR